ncbi:MAG: MBOAT family O-acyltransferase [Candidatus Ornithomonoglobus sp.]
MIFSTYKFIFCFFPVTFAGYFILGKLKQNALMKIWLAAASLVFYALGDLRFFPMFVMSIFGNFVFGNSIGRLAGDDSKAMQKKLLLTVGILANAVLLGYYKYTDFFIENFDLVTGMNVPLKNIVLPIGISFFTFQLIAYLVDSYRGLTRDYDILDYLMFITFFPQLIVGPIIHHSEAVPQFADPENQKINTKNICIGILMFSIGCAKKILLADPLTELAADFFNNISGTPDIISSWIYSVSYTISYYFDLSSYADMAVGLGLFFNIELPANFNSPYKARNFQDYWRRWHITLSRFLSAYIFRSWYDKNRRLHGYYAATMITFFVSGFWHGAGWTFIVWGLVNGILVCAASAMARKGKAWPAFVSFPLTCIGVVLCRILFVSASFSAAWQVIKGLVNFGSASLYDGSAYPVYIITLIIGILICWFAPNSGRIREKFTEYLEDKNSRAYFMTAGAAALFAICLMSMNKVASFLYFQF